MLEYNASQSSDRDSRGSEAPYMQIDPRLLLSSIIHDFNNLLTPIVNILEELQLRRDSTRRELGKIDAAIYCAFRAKILARQLIDFANPRPAMPEPTDMHQLLADLELVLASVLLPNIRLTLEIADRLPPAIIDQQLVERALLNLVLNARDAMPAGGDLIIAADLAFPPSSQKTLPKRMIRLSVSDNGVGMDDWTLKMAGQPNFSTKTNGTGLGLATVRQIVESLGGGLSMTSKHRHGTTIDLWLPATWASSSKGAGNRREGE
ncbi:ATP-binding protein [Mesorhizobium sangaii]|uniref:histidine kinase n=1 Tax=Mesorhizobium sangaii TaxID=505389 RepID=A0A841P8U1_9HYPH|nr:ATP-binding protein [Mesorhizobium sangaii]MBB6409228.1 signal transduction histidine kinase [Mesorhizobium sangaii]